jgi:hypothetical protein
MMLFSIIQPQPSAAFLAFMLSDVPDLSHLTRDSHHAAEFPSHA